MILRTLVTCIMFMSCNAENCFSQWRRQNHTNVPVIFLNPACGSTLEYMRNDGLMYADSSSSMGQRWKPLLIVEEASLGVLMGLFFAPIGGFIGAKLGGGEGLEVLGPAVIGALGGYVAGSTVAVYSVASEHKPGLSFLGTLAGGLVGSVVGLVIFPPMRGSGVRILLPLAFPVGFEILYAEIVE